MNRYLLPVLLFFMLGSAAALKAQPFTCSDLFFSEYVEGSSFEKYIEIYNPTADPIDLSDYELRLYSNGSPTASQSVNLGVAGTLASGAVVVFRNGSAAGYTGGFVNSSVINHNGDDAFELHKVSTDATVDIFGRIGDDPGSAWTALAGVYSTANKTLRRKATVGKGVTVNPSGTGASAFTTLETEWDVFALDDVTGLGAHTSNCIMVACEITAITLSNISECDGQGSIGTGDDSFTADVTVTFSNAPASGSLELTGDGSASVSVGSLGSPTAHTFTGVSMAADGTSIQLTATFSDEGACTLTETDLGTAPSPCSFIPDCGALFFSEYVEGSGNNKCLEIYNPTSDDIDLSAGGYQVKMYFNGSGSAGLTINLTGVIPSGGTYVLCNSGAVAEFTSLADQIAGGGWYNGNDVIELSNAEGVLDVIGQLGNSSNFAADVTLRRAYNIQKGDNDGSDVFSAAAEWGSYAQNTSWGLGYHATDCQPALPAGWNPFAVGCGGTSTFDDGEWTQSTNCTSPSVTTDNVTYAFQEMCGNGSISAQVTIDDFNASAGLMIRENLSPGAKTAWLFRRMGNQIYWKARAFQGGSISIQARPWLPTYRYIRLERSGNNFYGYVSTNGTTWIKLFQSFISMNSCAFVGLATESNVTANTVTAHFTNVSLSGQFAASRGESGDETASFSVAPQSLGLYPNPAQREIFVSLPESIQGKAQVSIVDLNGKNLYNTITEVEGDRTIQLDLQSLNLVPGIYLVRVENGSDRFIQRFVKQ